MFKDKTQISVSAHILGQRLNLKEFRHYTPIKKSPLMIEMGDGVAVLFRYGVVIFFGSEDDSIQQEFLEEVKEHITSPYEYPAIEKATIKCDAKDKESVSFDAIHLQEWDADRLLVIADILAKSQTLSYYESLVSTAFDRIEPISLEMQKKGRPNGRRARELVKYTASTLSAQRNMVGQAEILDKPDFLWEKPPELERLYIKLEDEYEIRERHDSLKEKLDLIYRTSEMMLGLLTDRHTLHVEWYIVILIIIDIAIHIAETYVF